MKRVGWRETGYWAIGLLGLLEGDVTCCGEPEMWVRKGSTERDSNVRADKLRSAKT